MTVEQLIELLEEFNPESKVIIDTQSIDVDDDEWPYFDVALVEGGNNKITVYLVAE
jgi:hypothetical protein